MHGCHSLSPNRPLDYPELVASLTPLPTEVEQSAPRSITIRNPTTQPALTGAQRC